jgi:trehalose synthase
MAEPFNGESIQPAVREIRVPTRDLARLEPLIGSERYGSLRRAAEETRLVLGHRSVWNVNSTAEGGGVAEMLQVLVGYVKHSGIDARWLVIGGDQQFFSITKRVHNQLHGAAGDGDGLGAAEAAHYALVCATNAEGVIACIRPGDLVVLHDPQTAGMAGSLSAAGVQVVWRCHVGSADANAWTTQAWSFLRPYLGTCAAFVFSRREFVPPWMDASKVSVIPPSIDPFSPKNADMDQPTVRRALQRGGILAGGDKAPAPFTRRDGSLGWVERRASIVRAADTGLSPDVPLVVQVSRWDRLKDMNGVMEGFVDSVAGRVDASLALVGPSSAEVADDPDASRVFSECVGFWTRLPEEIRRFVHLVTLPMDDVDENAALVNAVQRHATVVVQKSLAEGFGLTVAEAMWKSKPVVASAVGGIVEQVTPGTGVLLADPTDRSMFGRAILDLLARPDERAEIGRRAHHRVLEEFVGDAHLKRYAALIRRLASGG